MSADAPKLSRCERAVLHAIQQGLVTYCPTVQSAAREIDISTRSYRRALATLARLGIIARTPYHPRRAYHTPLLTGLKP